MKLFAAIELQYREAKDALEGGALLVRHADSPEEALKYFEEEWAGEEVEIILFEFKEVGQYKSSFLWSKRDE